MATISSDASATDSVTTDRTEWWLKDVKDPSLNIVLKIEGGGTEWDFGADVDEDVFEPLGSAFYVVSREASRGEDIALPLVFTTAADYQAFEDVRESTTLLLSSDMESQWYVNVVGPRKARLRTYGNRRTKPVRTVKATFLEVEKPEVS